uniref:Uncharacterized protein n=1 Tax=Tetranychus urticae TaxID=32264 RepID=T1KR68_TETUR
MLLHFPLISTVSLSLDLTVWSFASFKSKQRVGQAAIAMIGGQLDRQT